MPTPTNKAGREEKKIIIYLFGGTGALRGANRMLKQGMMCG